MLRTWEVLCTGARCDALLEPVLRAYCDPARHYHNLHHVAECLRELDPVRPSCQNVLAVQAALLLHDCVYDPARADNEERSADVASRLLASVGHDEALLSSTRRLILATRHATSPAEGDEQIVVDIDLSILAKSAEEFDAYERAIRLEYAFVPDDAFAAGRARLLRRFLARPSIYATSHFRQRYEQTARANLLRSLKQLEEPK